MNIYRFEKGILTSIKNYIDENLTNIANYIEYLDYEPAPNEITAFGDQTLKGVICVYTRAISFPTGSQNGNWNTMNSIEIDCYGFSKGAYRIIEGERVDVAATEAANLQSQALTTAAFLTVTNRYSLQDSFNVVDDNDEIIMIGEKYPVSIELFTQEDIERSQISQCVRKIKLNLKIEEQTVQLSPGELLKGFNYGLEVYNTQEQFGS